MSRIGLIGNFGGDIVGGQVQKTRDLYNGLQEKYESINKLDIYKKKPLLIFWSLVKVIKESEKIIIILASPGYFKLLPFIQFVNFFYKKDLFEFVIGGIRYQYLEKNRFRLSEEKKIKKIFVESQMMIKEYTKLGLTNVKCIPNFKCINMIISRAEIADRYKYQNKKEIHACTFSRIDKYKGINTAIKIIEKANELSGIAFFLDIIGPVSSDYENEFNKIMNASKSNILYLGCIKSEKAYDILKQYDILLFPTHWKAEGFPGTFIDAMSAGLPILATKKENFEGIIKNDYNGWLIDEKNMDEYVEKLINLAEDRNLLLNLKYNARDDAEKYDIKTVLLSVYCELL